MAYFCPALDPPLGGSGLKTTTLVRIYEYFILTKIHQNPSIGSGEEVENVKSLRTDGRRAMTKPHLSLELRRVKNTITLHDDSSQYSFDFNNMATTRRVLCRYMDQNI